MGGVIMALTIDEAKDILLKKHPNLEVYNVRRFNNRYVFTALPKGSTFDWDPYYTVDRKGVVGYFSPAFVTPPSRFFDVKPVEFKPLSKATRK